MIASIKSLLDTCSDDWVKFILGIAVGAGSFIVARILGFFSVNRAEYNDQLTSAKQLVASVVSTGCAYWSKAYDAHDKGASAEEQKIKTEALRISKYVSDLSRISKKFKKNEAEDFIRNLTGVVTGGDFEGKKRKVDCSRCDHIRDIGLRFEDFLTANKISKNLFN